MAPFRTHTSPIGAVASGTVNNDARFASTTTMSEEEKRKLLDKQILDEMHKSAKPVVASAVQHETKSNPGSDVGTGFMASGSFNAVA